MNGKTDNFVRLLLLVMAPLLGTELCIQLLS